MAGYEDDSPEAAASLTLVSLAAGVACFVAVGFASSPLALGLLCFGGCAGIFCPAIARLTYDHEEGSTSGGDRRVFEEGKQSLQQPVCDRIPDLPINRRWAEEVRLGCEGEHRAR